MAYMTHSCVNALIDYTKTLYVIYSPLCSMQLHPIRHWYTPESSFLYSALITQKGLNVIFSFSYCM